MDLSKWKQILHGTVLVDEARPAGVYAVDFDGSDLTPH